MSHQNSQPHSPDFQAQVDPEESAKSAFFDNMLMYGWLANRHHEVTGINQSLNNWMVANGHGDFAAKINSNAVVKLKDFLATILCDKDDLYNLGKEIEELIQKRLEELAREVEGLVRVDVLANPSQWELLGVQEKVGSYLIQTNLRVFQSNGTVLAGLRIIKPAAIRMNSNNKRDRVDIITVCQIDNEKEGWRVVGFQGQCQEAWLRVKAGIEAGTQAGTVGLMGRNMSHNIGSHALFYLEADETDVDTKRFYRYLRERMELLAGFSTGLSLSATTEWLGKIIDNFNANAGLLERIAKSERVQNVYINMKGANRQVALPAGVLGAQAFYTILENNIRDSAKHGRSKGSEQESLTITVEIREPENAHLKDEFIEVVISDDRGNFAQAGPDLQNVFSSLRIVDELGRLELGNWGIKERFIAAAILRGIRLEEIAVRQNESNQTVNLILTDYQPAILRIVDVNGSLGWAFYMMKPKEILLITDSTISEYSDAAITVNNMKWLQENIDDPSAVRHKFIVVRPWSQDDVDTLVSLSDKLPYRVLVCSSEESLKQAGNHFVPIDEESIKPERLSSAALYAKWVDWLVQHKRLSPPTPTAWQRFRSWLSSTEKFVMPETIFCNGADLTILSPDHSLKGFRWEKKEKRKYHPQRPVILFDSHGLCRRSRGGGNNRGDWTDESKMLADACVHYEPHMASDLSTRPLDERALRAATVGQSDGDRTEASALGFACTEAALIKIMIVDERLDPLSRRGAPDLHWFSDAGWSCTKNELFHWKGVDIRGGEYSEDEIPGREKLMDWVQGKGYDFLILHKGIVDKLIKQSPTASVEESKDAMKRLFLQLKQHVRQLIIHSGRMSMKDLPDGCKFMALSNVDTWLRNNDTKIQLVEDICLLRRV
jgi:hypothetical protein